MGSPRHVFPSSCARSGRNERTVVGPERPGALLLPFVEAALGALVAVGLFLPGALALGALLIAALVFGTALLQRWDVLTQQMVYALIYAALLATRSWDRWSLDAIRGSSTAG